MGDNESFTVNRKWSEIVGYSEDDMLNLTFQDITHSDDLDELKYVRQALPGRLVKGGCRTPLPAYTEEN